MSDSPRTARNAFLIALLALVAVLGVTTGLARSRAATPQAAGNAQNGQEVYEEQGCYRCHGTAGEGMPRMGKQTGSPKIAATHLSLQDFMQYVREPLGKMPAFSAKQITDAELSDVYAFLQAVPSQLKLELPSSASSEDGQKLYTAFGCYECHGYQGQGSTQTGGSRIGPPQIPYSSFVAYIRRPTGEMPPYSSKAVSDAQLADIYVFLQGRPAPAPSKSIPLLNQ